MHRKFIWLGGVVVVSLIFGTIYAGLQQSVRLGANNPQSQLAEDTAEELIHGAAPSSVLPQNVDISASLAPFVNIYDYQGNVVAGSGIIGGSVPNIPVDLLHRANDVQEYNGTWRPTSDVRQAVVVVKAGSDYVVSGRSLRQVENTETNIGKLVIAGWLVSLGTIGLTSGLVHHHKQTHARKKTAASH